MSLRQIKYKIQKIEKANGLKMYHEALILTYHLNFQLIKIIFKKCYSNLDINLSAKEIIKTLCEDKANLELKKIIANKHLKQIKHHFENSFSYFKVLKKSEPRNRLKLINEAQYCLKILNIAINKITPSS
mgnify:CR=1 FL=1